MEEADDLQAEVMEVPDVRWHWSFLLMHTVGFGSNVAHANRQIEQDRRSDFRAEAAEEIEAFLQEG